MAHSSDSKRAKTMDDIARLANVSKPTVSRALRDSPLVTEETKKRVVEVAAAYGYAVNRNAQKLRSSRTNTVAVVLDFGSHRENRVADPFIFQLLAGVSEALALRDQDLLLCSPGHSTTASLSMIKSSKAADGVIFLGQGARSAELIELAETDVPFVVWGAVSPELPYCVVGSDNVLGGRLAGRHLIHRGRRRFLFLGDINHQEISYRRQGLEQAVAESGKKIPIADIPLDDFSYDSSYDATCAYLREAKPVADGVFACSDTAAMAVICAYREAGFQIGKDVTVVGYNDIPAAAYFNPPLTTVRQDVHAAGELLAEKLMQIIDGIKPVSVTLQTDLIIRHSS